MSPVDFFPRTEATFISVRRWQAGAEWQPRAHAHPFCEVVVVLKGMEHAIVGGKVLTCEPGQFLFYPPNCVHEERQFGETLLEFFCLDFDWPLWPRQIPHRIQDRQGRVLEIARWMMSEDRGCYPQKRRYQDIGARMLAAELLRLVESPPDEVLTLVHDYVHQHLHEPISLDDLAVCAHLNKFHLARLFRSRTGVTAMEYVRNARLDFAHSLLLESDLPLREIAPRAGFANEYHLSRLIKARFGRGARELRRANRLTAESADWDGQN